MNEVKRLLLWRLEDSGGVRNLYAVQFDNGSVALEGQDLGDAVEEIFGYREYEYALTVQATDIPALHRAVGGDGDVLDALRAHFANGADTGPMTFLNEHNVPFTFWSRTGD